MKERIIRTITILFAMLLFYTGTSKVVEYILFKEDISMVPLQPISSWLTWTIPLVEFATAFSLIFRRSCRYGLYFTLALMLLFTCYLQYTLRVYGPHSYGFGGLIQRLPTRSHFIFNCCLILGAMTAIYLQSQVAHGSKPTRSTTRYYITLFIIITSFYACSTRAKSKSDIDSRGKPLPSFNLLLADSSTIFNTSDIVQGKPLVLFFYTPYCPYCRAEMDEIISDMDNFKQVQFLIFTMYPFRDMKIFYDHFNLKKYPNIIAGIDYTNYFARSLKISAVPYVAVYDSKKRLKKIIDGKLDIKNIIN